MAECRYIASDYHLVAFGCVAVLVGTQRSEGCTCNIAGGALGLYSLCGVFGRHCDPFAHVSHLQPTERGHLFCHVTRFEVGEVSEHAAFHGGDMPAALLMW